MPSGPRAQPRPSARWSKGCILCVKRKVKCDQKQPGCGNCQKYGRDCPGYSRELVFLPARTHRQPKSSPQETTINFGSSNTEVVPALRSPHVYQNQLAVSTGDLVLREYRIVWSWFRLLPEMSGRSPALDSAIRSFSVGLLARAASDGTTLRESHLSYVQSLSLLQKALYHPAECQSGETLCASVLLCLYEYLAGTTTADDYSKHIRGIGALIELRGPHPEKWTPFEISLIQTFRGPLIIGELFSPFGCTLVQERWRSFFRGDVPGPLPGSRPPNMGSMEEDYFDLLSQMPHITHRGYDLLLAVSAGKPTDAAQAADLVGKTAVAYGGWQAWIGELLLRMPDSPKEIPSPRGDALYPMVYRYDDVWGAAAYLVCLSCLLICNMVFMATGYGGDRSAEAKDLVDKICKSVETVSEGACGPYRVSFGLRIAFEAASPEVREWIKGWLCGFETRFKPASLELYPKITAADMLLR